MFNLDALSVAAQNERAADLRREADRERAVAALTRPTAGAPMVAAAVQASWRAAAGRLARMTAGLAAAPKRPQPAAPRS